MEVRDLLTKYGFPGDDITIVRGNAKGALDHPDDEKSTLASVSWWLHWIAIFLLQLVKQTSRS